MFTASYHTRRVRKEDLTDPKWKGRLGVEVDDRVWWGAPSADMGGEAARKLFDTIVAVNGVPIREGHSMRAGMVASGEVSLALIVHGWNPEQPKRKGAPVVGLHLQPLYAYPAAVAVMARARDSNACRVAWQVSLRLSWPAAVSPSPSVTW